MDDRHPIITSGSGTNPSDREWTVVFWLCYDAAQIRALELEAGDFFNDDWRLVFSLLCGYEESGDPVHDPTDLADRLVSMSAREQDAVQMFFFAISGKNIYMWGTARLDHVEYHARSLKKARYVREAKRSTRLVMEASTVGAAESARSETDKLLARLRRRFETITATGPQTVQSILETAAENTVKTGFNYLDYRTGGFPRGDIITLLGLPGIGKTTLALNMIEKWLTYLYPDEHVAFFSLEMPVPQVIERHLQARCGVTRRELHECRRGERDWPALTPSSFNEPLTRYMIRNDCRRIVEMRSAIRTMVKKPALIVIDYLGRMRHERASKPTERTEAIMQDLKPFAIETNALVLLLSQQRRDEGNTPEKMPRVDSGKWSSEIEAGSDFVLGMCRPNFVADTAEDVKKVNCRVGILKNRHGPLGRMDATFDLELQQITCSTSF